MHQDSNKKINSKFGQQGENLVAEFLKKNGFKISERNYRKRFGEIDLIALKGNTLIFVEVKSRKKEHFDLSEIINLSKQKKIIYTAKEYLAKNNINNKICRFDVAFVKQKEINYEIEYIANAFTETTDTNY